MNNYTHLILLASGVLAGFIDSIAGGGGLITIPTLSLFLTLGPHTIGTNKIAGTVSALLALIIYSFRGHMAWKRGWLFTLFIAVGSFLGSSLSPYLPAPFFRGFLICTCPLILWVLWKKDLWIQTESSRSSAKTMRLTLAFLGLGCGFYDGIWGPGGGTFMFLSLFFIVKLPLLTALAISKLANMTSAGISLINFARQKYVHWDLGLWLTLGISAGSFSGSLLASHKSERIVRPTLVFVTTLLLLKVLLS